MEFSQRLPLVNDCLVKKLVSLLGLKTSKSSTRPPVFEIIRKENNLKCPAKYRNHRN
jgi:hypothetical protein